MPLSSPVAIKELDVSIDSKSDLCSNLGLNVTINLLSSLGLDQN